MRSVGIFWAARLKDNLQPTKFFWAILPAQHLKFYEIMKTLKDVKSGEEIFFGTLKDCESYKKQLENLGESVEII